MTLMVIVLVLAGAIDFVGPGLKPIISTIGIILMGISIYTHIKEQL
jgi:hypothetical protein